MHYYGEWSDRHFTRVDEIAAEIGRFISKWGRMRVLQVKEKFGTVRVYCSFGWDCFHSLVWPRHCWIHRKWPYGLDLAVSEWVLPVLNKLLFPYQRFIYRMAYRRAVKKYPYLRDEILCCADHGKELQGVAGYRHEDYWKEV